WRSRSRRITHASGILRAVPPQFDERTYGPPRKSKSFPPLERRHGAWRGQHALRRLAVHRRQRLTRGPIARRASRRDESTDQPKSFPLRATWRRKDNGKLTSTTESHPGVQRAVAPPRFRAAVDLGPPR